MKPAEMIRFACGDCHVVFHLCLASESEWAEANSFDQELDIEPTCCPFCGAGELKPQHDRAVHA